MMARSALRDVRTRMWHADPVAQSTNLPANTLVRRPRTFRATASFYKANLIDISVVAAASLFVLYVALTFNIFSDPHQIQAETLEIDEFLLFFAVLILGSSWAGSRLITARRIRAA